MTPEIKCLDCKNFINDKKFTCNAFPDGIPDEIITGEVSHTKPYKGDHGIQFEPIDTESK